MSTVEGSFLGENVKNHHFYQFLLNKNEYLVLVNLVPQKKRDKKDMKVINALKNSLIKKLIIPLDLQEEIVY